MSLASYVNKKVRGMGINGLYVVREVLDVNPKNNTSRLFLCDTKSDKVFKINYKDLSSCYRIEE